MAITGTVTSAQGVLTLGSSLNDSITFTPSSATYTVEYPLGTVAIAASTSAQTLSLASGGQLRILCISGAVAYSLAEVRDSYALTPAELQTTSALVSTPGKWRPGLSIIGNSIPRQSCRAGASYTGRVATAAGSGVKPGSNQITLNGAISGLVVNDYIVVETANGQPWPVQVVGISGLVLTLAERLPWTVRTVSGSEAGVSKVTGPVYFGGTWRQSFGLHNYANALIGAPFEVLPGYGHGSALAAEILAVLPQHLAFYRPAVVMLSMFENDVPGTLTAAQMIAMADQAAAMCRAFNATPIVLHCLPSFSIGGTRADEYDDLRTGILSISSRVPGAIGIDPGAIYLDTSNGSTPRAALAGWSDGVVHPLESKRATIALDGGLAAVLDTLAGGSRPVWANLLYNANPTMAGTGGTAGTGVTGTVADSTTISRTSGSNITATVSKNADGSQLIVMAGTAAVVGSDVLSCAQTAPLPATWDRKTPLKMVWEVTVHSQSNLGAIRMSSSFGSQTMDARTSASTTELFDTALVGRRLVFETMAFPMLDPTATTAPVSLDLRPLSGVVASAVTVHNYGFALASRGEIDNGAIDSEDPIGQATRTTAYTVATLPTAAAGLAGFRAYVSDANATLTAGIGAVVAAGGANTVPVFCDGTNWRIG